MINMVSNLHYYVFLYEFFVYEDKANVLDMPLKLTTSFVFGLNCLQVLSFDNPKINSECRTIIMIALRKHNNLLHKKYFQLIVSQLRHQHNRHEDIPLEGGI